jgi:Mn-containing catalase
VKIARAELLAKLKRAYEMEEIMADLLTALAMPHVVTRMIPEQDRRKVRKMLARIHTDTRGHKKIVSRMIQRLSKGSSRGV